MATGTSLQNKATRLLKRFQATSREVSLRTITHTGGDQVLGLGQMVATTTTVLDPQPVIEVYSVDQIAHSDGLLQMGDYRVIMSGAVTEDTIKNSLIVYGDEVLKIVKYVPAAFDQTVVVWDITARAIKP